MISFSNVQLLKLEDKTALSFILLSVIIELLISDSLIILSIISALLVVDKLILQSLNMFISLTSEIPILQSVIVDSVDIISIIFWVRGWVSEI